MIIKEFEGKSPKHPMLKAGYNAEKQMAFYIKREFQASGSIFVLNDVRVSFDNDNAQIDHLIVYPAGVVIVESKSVSGELTINAHGDWIRTTGSKKKGMPSPIIQAQNQSKVLKRYLDNQNSLLGWRLPRSFKYDVFVAVSDDGIINREFEGKLDQLCKADQITTKVKEFALDVVKSSPKNLIKIGLCKELADNLNGAKKLNRVETEIKEDKNQYVVDSTMKCSKCNSTEIQIAYGRSYYFKCSTCEGNTPLKPWLSCATIECKPKIRKSKNDFFKECASCESSVLFFQNTKD